MNHFSQIFFYTIILLFFVELTAILASYVSIGNYAMLLYHSFFVASTLTYAFIQPFAIIIFLLFIF
jgi:hypothetical protein